MSTAANTSVLRGSVTVSSWPTAAEQDLEDSRANSHEKLQYALDDNHPKIELAEWQRGHTNDGGSDTLPSVERAQEAASNPSVPAPSFSPRPTISLRQPTNEKTASIDIQETTLALQDDTSSTASSPSNGTRARSTPTQKGAPIANENKDIPHISPSAGVLQSITQPYKNRFRFLALCFLSFNNGLCDSAPGALIPSMEKQYSIGYALVSLIFVGQAIGFILAAPTIDSICTALRGRGPTLAVMQSLLTLAFLPLALIAPYYPLVVVSFFFMGFCGSFNLAIGNVFCGGLRSGTTALGIMHGVYGIGGTVGPLIATGLVTGVGVEWGRFYCLTMALAALNCAFSGWSFWGYEAELEREAAASHGVVGEAEEGEEAALARQTSQTYAQAKAQLYGMFTAATNRVVLLAALFIFAYQGAEVSISGWVISFLMDVRKGDREKVGYVTAGFWGGITLGRFLLSGPAHRIGERKFVYAVTAAAAGFQVILWFVPNTVGNAVAVAIIGLLLGPVYPCAAAVFLRGMSKHEQVSGMGVISAFGSSGGAAAPFTTGFMSQAWGTFVLNPVCIFLYAVMALCWWGQLKKPKKTE